MEVYLNSEFLMYNIDPTIESLKKGFFECVAVVETDNLQEAFQLTNTIDKPWIENEKVKAFKPRLRSTSVGDVFKYKETFFVVESSGFKQLTNEEACELFSFIPTPPENPTPIQWKEYGVPGIEQLIEKGYKYVVYFKENEKPYGDPLAFKTTQDIASFMRTYPHMKMVWTRTLKDHFEILTDRPGQFKQYE